MLGCICRGVDRYSFSFVWQPSATGASKIAAKVVSVATSSSSGRGKVGKMSSATPSETIAPQADMPPKPLTAAAQKRASKLAASSSSSAAAMSSAAMGEDATELTLPPNRTSPATKRSRTTHPAASLVADHTAPPPVPPVAPAAPARAQPVSGQKPSPRAAAAASTPAGTPGPFSSSSSSYSSSASASVADATAAVDGAAVVAGISPTLFTRARARLPNSAPSFIPHPDPIPEESTGPFSAAFKLSDRRSSRGRSLSPAPVQGSGHAAPSSAGASSESAAGVSASASVAVAFEFRVTKGPCKGQVFRVACPGSGGDSGTGRGGAGKKSGSRAKAPLSVTQTVGRGDDGDGGMEVDVALSKDQHLSARYAHCIVMTLNFATLLLLFLFPSISDTLG